MVGSLSNPNEDGLEAFQAMDTLLVGGSNDARDLEQTALTALVTRVLVGRGWLSHDAERVVQGLGVKDLWAILREPQPKAAGPGRARTVGS
jgi:hypothetical protein